MPVTRDFADCQHCRFHSDDSTPLDIRALDLVDQIPWDFLDDIRANPKKRVDPRLAGGRRLAHWYYSSDSDPCDLKAFDAALAHLVVLVMTTEKEWDREGILEWLNWIKGRVDPARGHGAASLFCAFRDDSPDELLNFAAAHWFEAAFRFDRHGRTRRNYWMHPLLCCQFYLGTLSGPTPMYRVGRSGGENGANFGDRVVRLVLEHIRHQPAGEFSSVPDMCLKLNDANLFATFKTDFEGICREFARNPAKQSLEDTLEYRRKSKQRSSPVRSADLNQDLHDQILRVTGKTSQEVDARRRPKKKTGQRSSR